MCDQPEKLWEKLDGLLAIRFKPYQVASGFKFF